MANNFVVPFNYDAHDTYQFSTLSYSYTVPAGRYAIVNWTLDISHIVKYNSGTPSSGSYIGVNKCTSGQFILIAGDTLTRTTTSPTTISSASAYVSHELSSQAGFLINGAVVEVINGKSYGLQGFTTTGTLIGSGSVSTEAEIVEYYSLT